MVLGLVLGERSAQPASLARARLYRIRWRHRGHHIAVNNPALEEAQSFRVVTYSPLIQGLLHRVKHVSAHSGHAKLLCPAFPRVVHVMNGQNNPGLVQALLVVLLPVQHGCRRSLPFVQVDNVRLAARNLQELEARPAKVKVRFGLVVTPGIHAPPLEYVALAPIRPEQHHLDSLAGCRIDLSFQRSHLKLTVPLVTSGHVVLELELEVIQQALVDAFVERQDDLDVVPPCGAAPREARNHVAKAPDLGQRSHFCCEVHDLQLEAVHFCSLRLRPPRSRLRPYRNALPEGLGICWAREINRVVVHDLFGHLRRFRSRLRSLRREQQLLPTDECLKLRNPFLQLGVLLD
mmetsp:Transcript_157/g.379  ORF Transcript_157/g.379 Transcript_157/m.379 type:complete len:348 (+) Transcript_157:731-1774(+)